MGNSCCVKSQKDVDLRDKKNQRIPVFEDTKKLRPIDPPLIVEGKRNLQYTQQCNSNSKSQKLDTLSDLHFNASKSEHEGDSG